MTIRFGVSPIAWINDDMPELGGDTPLSTLLGDARDIGFAGVELGGAFPRDPAELRALLDSYALGLVGGWYSTEILTQSIDQQIEAMQPHLELLEALGSTVFVAAECSNTIHNQRGMALSYRPVLDEAGMDRFAVGMTALADHVAARGLRFAYHHHIGTVVETEADLDRLLARVGPSVGLTLDTGHACYGGIDVPALIRRAPERIAHVHCKDVRPAILQEVRSKDQSFLDGVLEGMFTVPGDGALDYVALAKALHEVGYSGWVIIEAEQDPAKAAPAVYARKGLEHLKAALAAAGLEVVR